MLTISLLDGSFLRWCTADRDLLVGGQTYLGNGIVKNRGNRRDTSKLEVDAIDLELAGQAQLSGVSLALRAVQGYFDDARVQLDHLVGPDPATAIGYGPVKALWEGRVAGIDPTPGKVQMGVASDIEELAVKMLPKFLYGQGCMHAVYDPNCGLNKATFTIAGTASGVPTTTTIPTATAGLTAKAAGYFDQGVLVFTGGALSGSRRAVKLWASNTFTLALPLPSAPAAGDAFTVYPGCPRTKAACAPVANGGKFDNLVNIRAFPHIPASEGAY